MKFIVQALPFAQRCLAQIINGQGAARQLVVRGDHGSLPVGVAMLHGFRQQRDFNRMARTLQVFQLGAGDGRHGKTMVALVDHQAFGLQSG